MLSKIYRDSYLLQHYLQQPRHRNNLSIHQQTNGKRKCDTYMYVCVLVTQSCPTLCDPLDCSPPGSSVHGILQARILEWVTIFFSTYMYIYTDEYCFTLVQKKTKHKIYKELLTLSVRNQTM